MREKSAKSGEGRGGSRGGPSEGQAQLGRRGQPLEGTEQKISEQNTLRTRETVRLPVQ